MLTPQDIKNSSRLQGTMTTPKRHLGQMFKAPLARNEWFGTGCSIAAALGGLSTSALRAVMALCQCCIHMQEASVVITRGVIHFLSAMLVLNRWMWLLLSVVEELSRSSMEQIYPIPFSLTNQTVVAEARQRHGYPSLQQFRGDLRKLRECALGVVPVFSQCCLSMWAAILALGGCIKPGLFLLWILSCCARTIIISIWVLCDCKHSDLKRYAIELTGIEVHSKPKRLLR